MPVTDSRLLVRPEVKALHDELSDVEASVSTASDDLTEASASLERARHLVPDALDAAVTANKVYRDSKLKAKSALQAAEGKMSAALATQAHLERRKDELLPRYTAALEVAQRELDSVKYEPVVEKPEIEIILV